MRVSDGAVRILVTSGRVDARELHGFLGVANDFSTWIKGRIEKYDFVEGRDFLLLKIQEQVATHGGSNKLDYSLTLPMAKELSMVENNEQGCHKLLLLL